MKNRRAALASLLGDNRTSTTWPKLVDRTGWIVAGGEIADISENEMEIWYSPSDRIDVENRPPGGEWIGPIPPRVGARSVILDNGTVLSVHSESFHPANGANRISILLSPFFAPEQDGVRSIGPIARGEWRVRLTGRVVRDGRRLYRAGRRPTPRRAEGSDVELPLVLRAGVLHPMTG